MALKRRITYRTKDGWESKDIALVEKGPSTQQMSGMRVDWRNAVSYLGQNFSSRRVTIPKCYEIRNDAMINLGMQYTKVPIVRLNWYIDCEDAQVASFVDGALREIYARYIMQYTNALDFGFAGMQKRFRKFYPDWKYVDPKDPTAPHKKVWDAGPVAAIGWRPFKTFQPEVINPIWTDDGDFNGFQWGKTSPSVPNDDDNIIDIYHALWVTNNKDREFGSLWGSSRFITAQRYWWSYWFRWALADRAFERHVDPPLAIFYPDDTLIDDETNEEETYESMAMTAGQNLRSGSTVTFPNKYIEDENGRPIQREWDFKEIESNPKFADLQAGFEYLDVMKLRAVLVPEQALIEGKGGTSSRNVASQMTDSFDESQAVLVGEIAEHINNFLIPQLIALNFPERGVRARFVPRGFDSADRDLAQQLIQLIGQDDPTSLQLDVREILRNFGMPLLTPEAQQKIWEQKLAREQQQAEMQAQTSQTAGGLIDPNAPPDQVAAGGETAPTGSPTGTTQTAAAGGANNEPKKGPGTAPKGGTTAGQGKLVAAEAPLDQDNSGAIIANGLYVQRRERIVLSDSFGERLRSGTHFFDSADTYELVDHIRDLMQSAYAEAYAHAADRIEEIKLEDSIDALVLQLGPVDLAKKVLALIGNTYLVPYRTALRSIIVAAQRLMTVAAGQELAKVGLDARVASQRPAKTAMKRWLDDRMKFVLKSLDETTQAELSDFIANASLRTAEPNEIAAMVKDHFSTFPDWKADRLARTEGRMAYNAALLIAGQMSGVDYAQASDASDGAKTTDEECMNRHGRFFKIEDALKEDAKEHPNGTLGWKLAPSVTTTEVEEMNK